MYFKKSIETNENMEKVQKLGLWVVLDDLHAGLAGALT
jgi:phosphatidylglycerophosphatase A